jgi:hypothetical protein
MTEPKKHGTPPADSDQPSIDDNIERVLDRVFAGVAPVKQRAPRTQHSGLVNWMRFDEARSHVVLVVGRPEWAARDLIQGVLSGEIRAIMLERDFDGQYGEPRLLKPEDEVFFRIEIDDQGRLLVPEIAGSPGSYRWLIEDTIYLWRDHVERKWRAFLPSRRPDDVPRKEWRVVVAAWKLWCGGYHAPELEVLKAKVCELLGWNPKEPKDGGDLSMASFKNALAWMQRQGYNEDSAPKVFRIR